MVGFLKVLLKGMLEKKYQGKTIPTKQKQVNIGCKVQYRGISEIFYYESTCTYTFTSETH